MKIIQKIRVLSITLCVLVVAIGCNNNGEFVYPIKQLNINVSGYNGSDNALIVKVDTSAFKNEITSNLFFNETVGINLDNYSNNSLTLSVINKETQEVLLKQQISADKERVDLKFAYIDGKIIQPNPPKPDPNTNKVGFYIIDKDNAGLADARLEDENLTTLTVIGKNIKPNQWVYVDIDFQTEKTSLYPVFYKAGTNIGYYKNDAFQSYIDGNPFFPVDGTKGEVRSFIIFYTYQANAVKL